MKIGLSDHESLCVTREVGKKLLIVNVIEMCLLLSADGYKCF